MAKKTVKPATENTDGGAEFIAVTDHATGKVVQMRKKQYDLLKGNRMDVNGKPFYRYSLGNAQKEVKSK